MARPIDTGQILGRILARRTYGSIAPSQKGYRISERAGKHVHDSGPVINLSAQSIVLVAPAELTGANHAALAMARATPGDKLR